LKVPRTSSARPNNNGTNNGQPINAEEAASFKFKKEELNVNSLIVG
jgi:hypothetical protein